MPMDGKELAERLELAAEAQRLIRKATLEWRAMGDKISRESALEPRRPQLPEAAVSAPYAELRRCAR